MTTIKEQMIQDYLERGIADSKTFRLLNKICDMEDKIMKTLSDEQKEMLQEFLNLEQEKFSMTLDDALVYGFEYAIKTIKELKEI